MFWIERRIRESTAMRTLNTNAEVCDTEGVEWRLLLSLFLLQVG